MEEATAEATEEMMEEGEKGAPASLPNTGAALPSLPSVIAVVMAVLAALVGGVSIRRRK
jgi:LPXTG-motif cell wall-anchored protein